MLAAYLIGTARDAGWRRRCATPAAWRSRRCSWRAVFWPSSPPWRGTANLFTENLWPVDFMRVAGFRSQAYCMPFDAASALALAARGLLYGAGTGGARGRRGPRRARTGAAAAAGAAPARRGACGRWPLVDLAARKAGAAPATRVAIETEVKHLLIGLSALPAVIFAVAAWTPRGSGAAAVAARWQRAVDLALVAAASAFALRAYNAFTPEGSYAPYYAAPLVLVAAIMHDRVGRRWPAAAFPRSLPWALSPSGCSPTRSTDLRRRERDGPDPARRVRHAARRGEAPGRGVRTVGRDTATGDRLLAARPRGACTS